jgi:hypothetical protein
VYSHDIEKFMREKPPDLKGACPFGGGRRVSLRETVSLLRVARFGG